MILKLDYNWQIESSNLNKTKLRLNSIEMDLQYIALKQLMQNDEIDMKNMLIGKPKPNRNIRFPQSSEK